MTDKKAPPVAATIAAISGAPAPAPAPDTSPADVAPPVKRGPGRPPGSKSAPVSPTTSGESAPKPRGRPKAKPEKIDGDALAKQVDGLHKLVALATGIPELNLQPPEAQMLGEAISRVCEEYDLSLSGKTGALLQLAAAAAMIYAPRLIAVNARVQAASRAKAASLHIVSNDGPETPHA
jgi:hypothetical protein